jgi:uncharacterized protein YbbC (DUF1343 family)
MACATGLDVLLREGFAQLRSKSLAIVCNQATVSSGYEHILDLLLPLHRRGDLRIQIVMGPQHGLFGHTQDNMIEWEGRSDPRTGLTIASLYGRSRKPTPAMLKGVDLLVVDLPDIGSRYYTFLWTTALCMEACGELGIPVMVLDRPNPIGGLQVEGTVLDPKFASFVGLHPLPMRHGLTLGEAARYFKIQFSKDCELQIAHVEDWSRGDYLDDTEVPWVMPSPNMPAIETAIVYPGACLLEGTNLSEGRGTTRPFEIFGAPYIDGWRLAERLNSLELPGVRFRPVQFQPTFQKHAGTLCEGCQAHVTDRRAFEPVLAHVVAIREARRQAPELFAWLKPPYEYEYEKLPFDILAGNQWLREGIEGDTALNEIRERFLRECYDFEPTRKECLLYPQGV